MKNTKALSLGILGMLVLQLSLVACDKSKEREETIDSSIKENLVQISDLHDITSDSTKAYFYRENNNGEISLADKTPQIKVDENINRVLGMVKKEETKKAIEAQMSSGLIAFAIMTDNVKVYKVMMKAKASAEHGAIDLTEIRKAKKVSLEVGKMTASATQIDLTESKSDVQYIEVASIKITKSGVLENKRTKYYDEKTSILTVGERPLDVSTHLLLDPEKTSTEETSKK
jgi:hypothetical protein